MKPISTLALAILFALPCSVVNAQNTPATTTQQVAPFSDVPPDHWAYNAVNELHQLGILIGYPSTKLPSKGAVSHHPPVPKLDKPNKHDPPAR